MNDERARGSSGSTGIGRLSPDQVPVGKARSVAWRIGSPVAGGEQVCVVSCARRIATGEESGF